jgi:hypothetical protein
VNEIENQYLNAQYHLGVLAGSLRLPISEDAHKALKFFSNMADELCEIKEAQHKASQLVSDATKLLQSLHPNNT